MSVELETESLQFLRNIPVGKAGESCHYKQTGRSTSKLLPPNSLHIRGKGVTMLSTGLD